MEKPRPKGVEGAREAGHGIPPASLAGRGPYACRSRF